MEHLIGGFSKDAKGIIDKAINFFEKTYSKSVYFEGSIEQNYFIGIIKEKSNKSKENAFFFENRKLLKSLYYSEIPSVLKIESPKIEDINSLLDDFIYVEYEKDNGIKVFIDKFLREKIYYSIKSPILFSTSMKFLISLTDKTKINYDVLTRFLISSVIVGGDTIFSHIKRLDVGEYLHIKNDKIQVKKNNYLIKNYFETSKHDTKDFSHWTDYLYDALKEAVRPPDNKPILSLMSAGLDSTVITSILLKEFDVPVEALTISVPNYNEEEVEKSIEIAKFFNIKHTIRETKIKSAEELDNNYSEVFNILEEPIGGSAFLSRYFSFKEISKMNQEKIITGDGGGEVLSFLRDFVINNFKYSDYFYHLPLRLRKLFMSITHKTSSPASIVLRNIFGKNQINSFDIITKTDFLQANSRFETFFTSYQFSSLEEINRITKQNVDFNTYLKPQRKNFQDYPFNDFNKYGYHSMLRCLNSDGFFCHMLSHYFDLKCNRPFLSDVAFKKILSLPPILKLYGYRSKWLTREMAKKKKLLPESYFNWKPKYGLRQTFMEENAFNIVKPYVLRIIESMKGNSIINLKPFMKYFNKITLKRITNHSIEYMKFNIWFALLGWLYSISPNLNQKI